MLHFAYGSNMSRALMAMRCPQAQPLGPAALPGWRFVISRNGYGSIARARGGVVIGVLWRLSVRDLAAVNAYESVDSGLYLRRHLAVRRDEKHVLALVFVARTGGEGRPRPGYMRVVTEAARDWHLPESYVRSIARWSPSRWRGARAPDAGELR
jgi:cation transport regulator ChaC